MNILIAKCTSNINKAFTMFFLLLFFYVEAVTRNILYVATSNFPKRVLCPQFYMLAQHYANIVLKEIVAINFIPIQERREEVKVAKNVMFHLERSCNLFLFLSILFSPV